jgi:alkane 1-monooxygenase
MALKHAIPFLALAAVPLLERYASPALMLPLLLVVFTLFDAIFGEAAEDGSRLGLAFTYRLLLWLYLPLQIALVLWGAIVAAGAASLAHILALALGIGAAGGIFGMLAAHDMIHSRRPLERALGLAFLASVFYMHFRLSHLLGHHRHAATPADPATARRGESAYRFIGRSVVGQWRQAWRMENARVAASRLPCAAHRMLHYIAIETALALAVTAVLGFRALCFLLAVSALAIFILELFNYVAHYGLLRHMRADGRRERLGPQHSWNVRRRFDNLALFNGGHHGDHHRAPSRAYQRLRTTAGAPLLPFGYGASLFLALLPAIWRPLMERRLSLSPAMPPFPSSGAPAAAGRPG